MVVVKLFFYLWTLANHTFLAEFQRSIVYASLELTGSNNRKMVSKVLIIGIVCYMALVQIYVYQLAFFCLVVALL